MKLLIMTIMLSAALFAGGDLLPVDHVSKFEKMDNEFVNNYVNDIDVQNNFKPIIIDNCVTTCGEPAEIFPYYGENIPLAETFPCEAYDSSKSHLSQY